MVMSFNYIDQPFLRLDRFWHCMGSGLERDIARVRWRYRSLERDEHDICQKVRRLYLRLLGERRQLDSGQYQSGEVLTWSSLERPTPECLSQYVSGWKHIIGWVHEVDHQSTYR